MRSSLSVFGRGVLGAAVFALVAFAGLFLPGAAEAAKPNTLEACTACHEAKADVVRGKFVAQSSEFKSLQVNVGPLVWVIKYDESTALKGAKSLAELTKDKELAVTWTGTEKEALATHIAVKPKFEISKDKQLTFEEMREYVKKGAVEGKFTLVDSRPPVNFNEGHIPWSINIPFPMLKKQGEAALPKEKDQLLIFYCGGET